MVLLDGLMWNEYSRASTGVTCTLCLYMTRVELSDCFFVDSNPSLQDNVGIQYAAALAGA